MKHLLVDLGGFAATVLVLALLYAVPAPLRAPVPDPVEAAEPVAAELTVAEQDLRAALYVPEPGDEPMLESGTLFKATMVGCSQLVQNDHAELASVADVMRTLGMCMSSKASRSRMPRRAWRALHGVGAHLAALPDHTNMKAVLATALRLAVLGGTLDPNLVSDDGLTLLHKAALEDDLPMAEALLQQGALLNVLDKQRLPPWSLARSDKMRALLELAEDCSRFDALAEPTANCMLGLAVGGCDTLLCVSKRLERARRCVDRALRAGATPNVVGSDGLTLLHTAVRGQHQGWLQMLINHGALVNTAAADSMTPLRDARRANMTEAVALLLAAGAVDYDSKQP